MTYFSRYIAVPLTAALVSFSFAAVPLSALADNTSHRDDADRVANVIPATPTPAIFIGPDGSVLVRGAKVTAIDTTGISATTVWGSANLAWTLHTTASTVFSNFSSATAASSTIAVGDIVSFKGSLDQTVSAFSVNVQIIRDWSKNHLPPNPFIVTGSVSSVSTTTSTFVLNKGDKSITVIASGASIMRNGTTTPFSTITTGSKVTAKGSYNSDTSTLTATSIVIVSPPAQSNKKQSFNWGQFLKEIRERLGTHKES